MFLKLFLVFTLIPAAEIFVFITIGGFIGALNTVLIIIITGVLGAYLARLQGMHTLYKIRASLNQGIIPTEELIDALIILAAGITLLTPGFLTDIAGLILLIPHTGFYVKNPDQRSGLLLRKKPVLLWGRCSQTPIAHSSPCKARGLLAFSHQRPHISGNWLKQLR